MTDGWTLPVLKQVLRFSRHPLILFASRLNCQKFKTKKALFSAFIFRERIKALRTLYLLQQGFAQ